MYTRCPTCETLFHVTAEQLGMANGLVRCGLCGQSFTALGRLYETLPPDFVSEVPAAAEQTPAAPVAGTESTGRSGAAIDWDAVDELAEEDLPHLSAADGPGQTDGSVAADLPPVLRADLEAEAHAGGGALRRFLSVMGALVLVALLGAQYAYYHRGELAANPVLRPWLARACDTLGCTLPLRRDPARIELLARDVRSDPARSGALLINATFVNRAAFTQAYPLLGLRFSDLSGNLVAGRYFRPRDYLPDTAAPESGMTPGDPVHVTLEIQDPGQRAVSYQFDFR